SPCAADAFFPAAGSRDLRKRGDYGGGTKEYLLAAMGKTSNGGLGRALVRHHNQMVQHSKEKGVALRDLQRRQKPVLESVTEISDIDAILELPLAAAAEAADYSGLGDGGNLPGVPINLRGRSSAADDMLVMTAEERRKQQEEEEALHSSSLRVPRRPPWTAKMSPEELDVNERQTFLAWRRSLARLEENEKLVITPFEKNLDIWRQLWRVLERSDLLVMVVDARDPFFYRCPDLEAYAREIDEHKRTLLLVNKADLLPITVRQRWANYFRLHGTLFVFWSAKAASAVLESKRLKIPWEESASGQESASSSEDTKIYSRNELLSRLQAEAEAIVARRNLSGKRSLDDAHFVGDGKENTAAKHVVVGFVGYPNVGKSSTINALVGEKRTGVTSTPGKTKHFQTLIISDDLMLCDCPGLVFPSFSSSRYEMIASGVLPIDRMTEHREAVQVVANHVPRQTLERVYNISLPKPKPYELLQRPVLASELLRTYCSSRGYVSSGGLPDETRAARQILKDYIDGKLPHFEMPPDLTEDGLDETNLQGAMTGSGSAGGTESDNSDPIDPTMSRLDIGGLGETYLGSILSELESFDTSIGPSAAEAVVAARRKPSAKTHKHHMKPQRKKDRSWRVGNDDGDGMPA
ncbi:hypothetical protein Taro_016697, partial [Colocasia esculenta]|nr:hypothetical protein [Colocasia esculenta]